jgi:hypothetical protein
VPLLPRRRPPATRWEEDNRLEPNLAAYALFALLGAAAVALALLVWLL